MEGFSRDKKEKLAFSLVHSTLIVLLALTTYRAVLSAPQTKTLEPKVLSSKQPCEGTKLNYPRVASETLPNGKTTNFRYNCMRSGFIASSYDGNCPGCSGKTRLTDEPVRWGLCAVDTDVILPKSVFYVPGYGPCLAADTGGAVKGKKIDVGFSAGEVKWWSKRVTDIYTFVD
ncbi:hypothetical protein GTO10_02260 [Candidatus Saccharibacteria bacterium]|nr:hypothetical protein [Candidatus Saccharibacteria bacterium]